MQHGIRNYGSHFFYFHFRPFVIVKCIKLKNDKVIAERVKLNEKSRRKIKGENNKKFSYILTYNYIIENT